MKTKLPFLAVIVAFVTFSSSSFAAILSNPFVPVSGNTNFNVVTPTQGSGDMLTNATILKDGTVISHDATTTTTNIGITDNAEGTLSYHHGSSGGGDGIKGKNIITLSVGFVSISGLLTSSFTAAGYSVSSIPPITLCYQRGLSERLGFGAQIAYTSFTLSENGVQGDPFFNNGNSYTYNNKETITGIGFGLVGTYDFVSDGKVLPYLEYGFGYEIFSASFSTTDPNVANDGNVPAGSISGGLPWFNLAVGCRFFFTDSFGAFAEVGWHGLVGGIIEVGLAVKL